MTLLESLLNFSKDNETLSLEDLAEHHHLRHNQSVHENPSFRFGNKGAICSLYGLPMALPIMVCADESYSVLSIRILWVYWVA